MEGIHEDGYQSTEEDEFHLTTSGEFCDGASRRTRAMDLPGVLEELDLEELKLWDQEDAQRNVKFYMHVSFDLLFCWCSSNKKSRVIWESPSKSIKYNINMHTYVIHVCCMHIVFQM